MKKLWFMLAMMICILASCSDGGSENPVNPTPKPEEVKTEITIDSGIISNGLSFGVTEGEQSISFSVNANWTLSVASTTSGTTWCKASATSGSKGSATVKFSVDENTGYDDRSVSVTIKAGSVSKTFTITQKGADALLVTTTKYEVAQEGGQIEIEVKANISYQMEISEDAKGWITEAESKGRALTTTKHKLNVAMNENAEKREGEITFKSGDKVETVKVYQAGGAILLLSQSEYTVSDAGETISVDIKSNIDFGVLMPEVDWISDEASSRGMSSHTLKYIVAVNETYDSRSAEIVFYDKNSDLKDTLKVVQAQKDAIILSEKNISVAKEGGTIEVKVNTNVDFEVQIPSEATWISQTDSRALKEKSVYLKVDENVGEESRSVEIMFSNSSSQISESVTINQAGVVKAGYENGVVNIAVAGTMKELLGDDYLNITSLKVVGPINGDDVYYLRKMLGGDNFNQGDWGKLTTLDLSEATIVSGGSEYYEDSSEKYYTSYGVIGDYMFWRCSNLNRIMLPNNVSTIGKHAIQRNNNLQFVTIGSNTTTIGLFAFSGCGLKSLTLPDKIETIGEGAFSNCKSLEYLKLPNGVSVIGEHAFRECNFESIVLPLSVTKIGDGAFECESLKNIYINDLSHWCRIKKGTFYAEQTEGYRLFLKGKNITKLIIPNDISSIENCAFYGCGGIETVEIHDKVVSIGRFSFGNCANLSNIIIGKSVTSIGNYAFVDCINLESLIMPDNVTTLGEHIFSNCRNLKKCTLSKHVNSIPSQTFSGCKSLKEINLNYVDSIGTHTFSGCDGLNEIIIPDRIKYIGDAAFNGCDRLKNVTIGKGLSSISDYTFERCI